MRFNTDMYTYNDDEKENLTFDWFIRIQAKIKI